MRQRGVLSKIIATFAQELKPLHISELARISGLSETQVKNVCYSYYDIQRVGKKTFWLRGIPRIDA